MTRSSKVQTSKIALFWAVLTFAIAVVWTVSLNALRLSGTAPAVSLAVPVFIGAGLSIFLYFARAHQILDYNDDGYSVVKGRATAQEHKWSEFKECSVIRDGYGRNKVRVYRSRDGEHFDIDSTACGLNPFAFRDFILTRINNHKVDHSGSTADVFDGLEREVQRGRARWIADLNETFKLYEASGEIFHLMARGGTRPKGFLLSRFLAVTVMPNYEVSLYAQDISQPETATRSRLMRFVRVIETLRDQKNIKWSWLLLFCDEAPPAAVSRFIEEFGNKDIGIGCIDTGTGHMITSPNQLGRSLSKQMRLHHLMRDLAKARLSRQVSSG